MFLGLFYVLQARFSFPEFNVVINVLFQLPVFQLSPRLELRFSECATVAPFSAADLPWHIVVHETFLLGLQSSMVWNAADRWWKQGFFH